VLFILHFLNLLVTLIKYYCLPYVYRI